MQTVAQEVLEAEMEEALGAAKGERTEGRLGYRSGHDSRELTTQVGTLELRVPQDRQGRYPKLCDWVEENIEETFTRYRWPKAHPKHPKSTTVLERLNQEIKRRAHVVPHSFRTLPVVFAWCERWRWRSTRTGLSNIGI